MNERISLFLLDFFVFWTPVYTICPWQPPIQEPKCCQFFSNPAFWKKDGLSPMKSVSFLFDKKFLVKKITPQILHEKSSAPSLPTDIKNFGFWWMNDRPLESVAICVCSVVFREACKTKLLFFGIFWQIYIASCSKWNLEMGYTFRFWKTRQFVTKMYSGKS
jgi:hypothetical protein